ncbi:hypothetical protein [Streptacidiphilus sp. MAP5-52]|uniref:hypothetical protein n=1 Tax=Streptacidiphilus sp. MAP5-52 TaxID=3156267 RepID=UPI003513981F
MSAAPGPRPSNALVPRAPFASGPMVIVVDEMQQLLAQPGHPGPELTQLVADLLTAGRKNTPAPKDTDRARQPLPRQVATVAELEELGR